MALGSFWRRFLDVLPKEARYVATVVSFSSGQYTLQLPGGSALTARGPAGYSVASQVFVAGGVVEGPATSLPTEVIEV